MWKVDVADGKVTVTEGGSDGDVTIRASEETFTAIASGEQNPTTAYMTGKLKVEGDMGAALKLQKLFYGAPTPRARRGARRPRPGRLLPRARRGRSPA